MNYKQSQTGFFWSGGCIMEVHYLSIEMKNNENNNDNNTNNNNNNMLSVNILISQL